METENGEFSEVWKATPETGTVGRYRATFWVVEGGVRGVSENRTRNFLETHIGTINGVSWLGVLPAGVIFGVTGAASLIEGVPFSVPVFLTAAVFGVLLTVLIVGEKFEKKIFPIQKGAYSSTRYVTEEEAQQAILLKEKYLKAYRAKNWAECRKLKQELDEHENAAVDKKYALENTLAEEDIRSKPTMPAKYLSLVEEEVEAKGEEGGGSNLPEEETAGISEDVLLTVVDSGRISWVGLRKRHGRVKEKYGEYKSVLSGVYTYPLMFDSASLLTASFEECLVAAEDAEVSGDVGQYRSAVEELEDVWEVLVLKAVNGRDGFYPEATRGVLSTARKLAVKAESTDSSDERMELLRKAVELGNQTTVRVPDDLASRLAVTAF